MSIQVFCPDGHSVSIHPSKLDQVVHCPECFASFRAEQPLANLHAALPDKGKRKPSRDDDEDEEAPPKKTKEVQAKAKKETPKPVTKKAERKKDDEDEKPGAKKALARKRKDDDDDEEGDDEDEDKDEVPAEEEEPIDWTPRKRQLNVCDKGLIIMMVAYHLLAGFALFWAFTIVFIELDSVLHMGSIAAITILLALSLFALALVGLLACAFTSLAIPAKAEGRGALIAAILFGILVLVLGVIMVLNQLDYFAGDAVRKARIFQLLGGTAALCFVICMIGLMSYMSKLLIFMKMHLESSQPITNAGFTFMGFFGILVLSSLSPMLKDNLGDWTSYLVAFAVLGQAGYVVFMMIGHVKLIKKLRKAILNYIKYT